LREHRTPLLALIALQCRVTAVERCEEMKIIRMKRVRTRYKRGLSVFVHFASRVAALETHAQASDKTTGEMGFVPTLLADIQTNLGFSSVIGKWKNV
jgi:hypothetical protein